MKSKAASVEECKYEIERLKIANKPLRGFLRFTGGVSAKIKYHVIDLRRSTYTVRLIRQFFGVSKSGYCSFIQRLERVKPDAGLAQEIRECQTACGKTPQGVAMARKPRYSQKAENGSACNEEI